MTNNQTSGIMEAVQNAKNSSIFKNLSQDVKALIKDPEAFFREIYHQPRLTESLVLVGTAIVLNTVMSFASSWSLSVGLYLDFGSYLTYIGEMFLRAAIQMLLFFGTVFIVQTAFISKFKSFSLNDLNKTLTLFAYGLLPFAVMLPLASLFYFANLYSLALLCTAFENTSFMLIGLGIMCQKEEKIQISHYLVISTAIFLGAKLCGILI